MTTCDSTSSLILDFLTRRLDQSPPFCESTSFDSRRLIIDYAVREINLLLWLSFFAITSFLIWEFSKLFKLRCSHARRISRHVSSSPSSYAGDYVLFTPAVFHPDLNDKTSSPIWPRP